MASKINSHVLFRAVALAVVAGLACAPASSLVAPATGLGAAADDVPKSVAGLEEPLVATAPSAPAERRALDLALARLDPSNREGLKPIEEFLAAHPASGWRLALQVDAGLWYYREGYFSRAIDAWEDAWATSKSLPVLSTNARALADRAVGELIRMHARLGHEERLKQLLAAVEGRHLIGPATELVAGAKQGLWMMDNDPGVAFLCGPNALRKLALLGRPVAASELKLLESYRSGPSGVSLAQVGELAKAAKLPYKPAFRAGDAAIPVPSVVHWKVGHYAAIVGEEGGRYHVQDPTFGTDLWVSRDAVEKESSGFFLVKADTPLHGDWRAVTAAEGLQVHGMGFTSSGDPDATRDNDPKEKPDCNGNQGMCGYNAHSMNVSLNLVDTPVGYQPAVGPDVRVRLVYNQREARQPTIPTFFNFGPKWTSNWLGYVVDVPNRPGVNVMSYVRGGGAYDEAGYAATTGKFLPEAADYSVLQLVSQSPIQYQRRFRDGSVEVYAASDGAGFYPRRVFLSQVIDPAGNAVNLTYDASKRLTKITDAVGRASTLTYGSSAFPLQPTKITDPFNRSANIAYDASGRLLSITDTLGLTSSMTYDAGSFITKLTTPYGASTFAYTESGPDRTLEMTDPLGYAERVESKQTAPGIPYSDPRGEPAGMDNDNQYLYYRNTFYWDKHAYSLTGIDYTKAKIQHWYHDLVNFNYSSSAMSSSQEPLEGRVWRRTPNDSGLTSGTYNEPRQVGRVLDDGSSQVTNTLYNKAGNVTSVTDPAGRNTLYTFAPGGIDVVQVRQRGSSGAATVTAQYTYNSQHQPLTFTDAAGQTTQYAYNAAGQLTSKTNALGQVWAYEYDALGELTRVVNPDNKTAVALTYDGFGRVATRTDSEGRAVAYAYDAMDRLLTVTYPDATTETFGYDKLDRVSYKDRLNRVTSYVYDANRNLTSKTDPLLHVTAFTYYRNGALLSQTDAKGNATTWQRDLQSRVIGKTYADGSTETFTWETYGGRLKSRVDASGRTQTYSYRNDDLPSGIAYSGGPVAAAGVSFAYDRTFQRLTSMTDGTGTTRYRYGAPGAPGALKLAVEDGPYANDDINYAYDALGRLSSRTVAGSAETVAYDALGRISSGQNALGNLAYAYLGETHQVASESVGANARATYTYETNAADRRLKAIANLGTRGYQYTTNAQGVVTSIVDSTISPVQSRTWTPTYDAGDRLLTMALSTGATYRYGYDGADNITSFVTPGGTVNATYGVDNQLTALGGTSVVVDAAGNLLDDGKRTYQWDAAGRLATILYKAQPTLKTQFRYDGFGRRVGIVETAGSTVTETHYLWCGNALCQSRDASDNVTKRYFKEGEYGVATAAKNFYNRDRLGSVRDVTGPTGAVVASLDYDAYGNLMASAGTTTSTDFRYAGMFYHPTSGLYLTWNRVYDASSSRWLSREPLMELAGPNLYSYVRGNPARYVDPLGTAPGDKWYGYNDKNFQDWVHGQKQDSGRGARENYDKEDLDDLWDQWNEEGRPRGKGGKSGRGGQGRGAGDCDPEQSPQADPETAPDTDSGGDNTALYVAGGVLLVVGIGALIFFTGGGALAAAPAFASDRALKENLREVDGDDILRRLASMPVTAWNYRSDGERVRHIGPMAQDFKASFALGERETEIAMVDACGVLMASVQALKRQLDEKSTQIDMLQRQLESALAGLQRLEQRDVNPADAPSPHSDV